MPFSEELNGIFLYCLISTPFALSRSKAAYRRAGKRYKHRTLASICACGPAQPERLAEKSY
jgi:hypothetical protein